MVFITRNFEKANKAFNGFRQKVQGDSNRNEDKTYTVHGSDMLWCLRQAYYKKLFPKDLTPAQVMKFLIGKISEQAIGDLIYAEDHYIEQLKVEKIGIVAHPDIISHEENKVIELKQTDKKFGFTDPRDTLYNSFISYCTQTLYYLYLSNKKYGEVTVNHSAYTELMRVYKTLELDEVDKNPLRVWDIEIESEHDYNKIEADILFKKELLERAFETRDIGYLPKLETIDINDMNKCNICDYAIQCKTEPDYWDRLKFERVVTGKAGFTLDSMEGINFVADEYTEFKERYGDEPLDKTNVNYLYRTMLATGDIWYGKLGRHYKDELGGKKKK